MPPRDARRCFCPNLSQRAPRVPRSFFGSTRSFLLQICSCPAVLNPKCALHAQEVTSSARDRFYSRGPVRAPRRQKRLRLAFFPACHGGPDSISHHHCALRIRFGAREPGKSQERPGELSNFPICVSARPYGVAILRATTFLKELFTLSHTHLHQGLRSHTQKPYHVHVNLLSHLLNHQNSPAHHPNPSTGVRPLTSASSESAQVPERASEEVTS